MTDNLLKLTKAAFTSARKSMVEAMQYLHAVYEEEAWKEVSPTWGEYLESELGVSQSQASKLLSVNRYYLLEGELNPDEIAGVDYEKLNAARSLPGTVEENLAKAKTLSRRELKDEGVDGGHVHSGETVEIHKCCGMRV